MLKAFRIAVALLPAVAAAQTVKIDVRGVTSTQAILHAVAKNVDGSPYAGSCTFRVSEGTAFSASVNDVNETLFAGSSADSRPGSVVVGADRYFVAGGRVAAKASDGNFYSRALQAATTHWAGATCGTAAEVATVFTTGNVPLGNSYPEVPGFDSAAFGNLAIPTVDWTNKDKVYIEPLTGIAQKRVSGPLDNLTYGGQRTAFAYVRDLNGSWTNAANALTNQNAATLASITVPNAPLFLSWNALANTTGQYDVQPAPSDVQLRAFCRGSSGGTLSACLSTDSGQSCATQAVDIACPAAATEVKIPANFPAPLFQGWGKALSKVDLDTGNATIRVSGNTVYRIGGVVFNTNRAPGTKIRINGSAANTGGACASDVCTIAKVNGPQQLTLSETFTTDLGGSVLALAAAAGATSLRVNGTGGLYAGEHLSVDNETVQVSSAFTLGSTTIPLTTALSQSHSVGATVAWAGKDDGFGHIFAASAGATVLTAKDWVVGTLGAGQPILMDIYNANQETVTVSPSYVPGSSTIPLSTALVFDHPSHGTDGVYIGWNNDVNAQDYAAGVRVSLKNTGGSPSVSASFTFDHVVSNQFVGNSNGGYDACSSLPVTDILKDRTGNALPSALSGYLCNFSSFGQALYLYIPSTGEFRLLSEYWGHGAGLNGLMSLSTDIFSDVNAKTFYATNVGTNHLYQGVYSGDYTEYSPGPNTPPVQDAIVWTDITANSAAVADQLRALQNNSAATEFRKGIWPDPVFIAFVGGYALYGTSVGGDSPCMRIRTRPDTNTIVQAVTSWTDYPNRWAGCHSSPVSAGSLLELTSVPTHTFGTTGGPFRLKLTQVQHSGVWQSFSQGITAATNAANAALTSPGLVLDPYAAGPTLVDISGGTGSWAAANGSWVATRIDDNTFSIPVNSSTFGPLTGAMSVSTTPPLLDGYVDVSSQLSVSPPVVRSRDYFGAIQRHRLFDGDAIQFSSSQTQFYAKATGNDAFSFALYLDSGLTRPAAANAVGSNDVYWFAEACPAGLDPKVTSQIIFDIPGAVGQRCITVRAAGEPCSRNASAAESAAYPCKSDPSNTSKSSLQDLQLGDQVLDMGRGFYPTVEHLIVASKVKNSETDMVLTLMRFGYNQAGGDDHTNNPSSNSHATGWTPMMGPTAGATSAVMWIDAKDSSNTWIPSQPAFGYSHADFGWGNAPGLFTYAPGTPDPIVNQTMPAMLAATLTYTHQESPSWAGSAGSQLSFNFDQSYPSHRQKNAPPAEHVWKGDWRALNPLFGYDKGQGGALYGGQTVTNIRGTAYDTGNATNIVYKITNGAGSFDAKRTPLFAWAGRYILKDMSGPGSSITDANAWSFCVAYSAGECRTGSAKNDAFVAMPSYNDAGGTCVTNTFDLTSPCLAGLNSKAGWAEQAQLDPIDTVGNRYRRLTFGFSSPGRHFSFQSWLQAPDGQWGFYSAPFVNGLRNDIFAMKLPPWPASDSVDRMNFVPVTVSVPASSAWPKARVRFGYAENGPVSGFYCTSRQDGCSTETPSASPGDPFAFLSEARTAVSCGSGCRITVPAIPGRVLYYVLDRLDAAGTVQFSGPMQVVAAP